MRHAKFQLQKRWSKRSNSTFSFFEKKRFFAKFVEKYFFSSLQIYQIDAKLRALQVCNTLQSRKPAKKGRKFDFSDFWPIFKNLGLYDSHIINPRARKFYSLILWDMIKDCGMQKFNPRNVWSSGQIPLFHFSKKIFVSKNLPKLFFFIASNISHRR